MDEINPKIQECWKVLLSEEFKKQYFYTLKNFLILEKQNHIVYPKGSEIFNAFNLTSCDDLKVVIIGQDPYHGTGQAHGLAFSVNDNIPHPPSLQNIFKELQSDIGCAIPKSGNLIKWAKQGVFLLNSVLSVRANEANSHKNQGWEYFTDAVIKKLSENKEHLVFILWGSSAGQKSYLIDENKHLILKAPHPSPLSSYRGFFGSKPFSQTNAYLKKHSLKPIDWAL